MAPPTFVNSGKVMYDVAITGLNPDTGAEEPVPFLFANSEDYPYLRESDGGVREQVDTTGEPGEQSLTGYWYRSQSSFDLGMGAEYFDSVRDESLSRRFKDSCGVDVFTPGKVSLLNAAVKQVAHAGKTYATPYAVCDVNGQITDEGVLVAKSTFGSPPTGELVRYSATTGATVLETGIDAIYDVTTNGGTYYVLRDDAITIGSVEDGAGLWGGQLKGFIGSGAGNIKRGRIAVMKDRLIVALTEETASEDVSHGKVYDSPIKSASITFGDPLCEVAIPGWRWTGICEGPNAVYLGGYSGGTGRIYALTLNTTETPPVLNSAYVVAELPSGEQVTSVVAYISTYLIVGTNRGVRVATINPDASLTMGPLSVRSDTPVWSVCAVDDHIYAGGSFTTPHGEVARPGLYKLNLGVDGTDPRSQLGMFPTARDLYAPDADNPGVNQVLRVCPLGNTGRVAFTVDNVGLYVEGTSKVPNGWLRTGRIRFDTQERKAFDFLRVNRDGGGVVVTPSEEHDGGFGTLTPLVTTVGFAGGLSTEYEAVASRTSRYQEVRYTFLLTNVSGGNAFTGYQVRARPSNVVSRTVRLPLLCFPREKTREGLDVDRPTWRRIRALELMERRGGYVRLQNLNTGENELATFESVQFLTSHTQQSRGDQANPGGILVVTLRLVNQVM